MDSQQHSEPPSDLISVREAAKHLGVGLDTIYRNIHNGTLPAWVLGERLKVSKAGLSCMFRPYVPAVRLTAKHEREQQIAAAHEGLRVAGVR